MLNFKYTKKDGEVSNRVGIVLRNPMRNYLMFDVTQVDSSKALEIESHINHLRELEKIYLKEQGVKYRSFDPDYMEIKE